MGHPMFEYDPELANSVFEYCRERLSLDPVPLDYGSQMEIPMKELDALITVEGRNPEEVLEFFKTTLAPAVVSIDSPGFLAFIPNAPTKNSLLFDMVVACSGLNGTSWLESSGVVVAENQALGYIADVAGLPSGSGGAFVAGGSIGNLSSLTVGRDVGRAKNERLNPHDLRFAISSDAHSSIGKALHVLDVKTLVVETDDHRFTRSALEAALGQTLPRNGDRRGRDRRDDQRGHHRRPRRPRQLRARARPLVSHRWGLRWRGHLLRVAPSPVGRDPPRRQLHRRSPQVALRTARLLRLAVSQSDGRAQGPRPAGELPRCPARRHGRELHWNPSDFGIHLSRRARGLPFWFSLVTNGTAAYQSAVQTAIDLAQRTERLIEASEDLEMVRPSSLSIVLFRRKGWDAERYNEWSQSLLSRQIAFVTPTKWEGETVARMAFLHPNTTDEMVEEILASMRD